MRQDTWAPSANMSTLAPFALACGGIMFLGSSLGAAKWDTRSEQLVAAAPRSSKRTDLLVTRDSGHVLALDFSFTAPLKPWPPDQHLSHIATTKAGLYLTVCGGVLPCGACLIPVIFAATRCCITRCTSPHCRRAVEAFPCLSVLLRASFCRLD